MRADWSPASRKCSFGVLTKRDNSLRLQAGTEANVGADNTHVLALHNLHDGTVKGRFLILVVWCVIKQSLHSSPRLILRRFSPVTSAT